MGQLFSGNFIQKTPNASVADVVAPTFGGITGLTPNVNGALMPAWSAATDANAPIEYLIYVALGTVNAATLFQASNLVTIAPAGSLNKNIFTLANQTTYFVKDQDYTVGVRAKDAFGNISSNTQLLTATSLGYVDLPSVFQNTQAAFAATQALLATDQTNFAANNLVLAAHLTTLSNNLTTFAAQLITLGVTSSDLHQTYLDLQSIVSLLTAVSSNLSASLPSYVSGKVESTNEVIGLVESIDLASA